MLRGSVRLNDIIRHDIAHRDIAHPNIARHRGNFMAVFTKEFLSGLSILLALVSYVPYIYGMIKGTTRPHAFSWFIWAILTCIAFAAQITQGGGVGSWLMGFTALMTLIISIAAFFLGKRDITRGDWICFLCSLAAIPLWMVTKDPRLSIILITLIDAVAFYPTFRKAFFKPYEEVMFTYVISTLKFGLGIIALEAYNISTVLYPFSLVIMNAAFVMLLIARRRIIPQ